MASKEILGRNILDLIEENKVSVQENETVENLPVSSIRPNPDQPRVVFKRQSMDELAQSIKEHGICPESPREDVKQTITPRSQGSNATDEFGCVTKRIVSFRPTPVPIRLWLTE